MHRSTGKPSDKTKSLLKVCCMLRQQEVVDGRQYSHNKMIAWSDVGKHGVAAIFKRAIDIKRQLVV